MSFLVTVLPSNRSFELFPGESILQAGLRAGLNLDFGCSNGNCGRCMVSVHEGQTEFCASHDYLLSEADRLAGKQLSCCASACSDLIIEAHEAGGVEDIPLQTLSAKVARVERIDGHITVLHIKTPRSQPLRFLAGQYVQLTFAGGQSQCFGIASCPCDGRNLRVHVVNEEDADITDYILNHMRKNASLEIKGPGGHFTLDETSIRPIVFVAAETGFAPIQSIIEHAIALEIPHMMHLYRLSTYVKSHYLSNYCRSWRDVLDNFRYTEFSISPAGEFDCNAAMTHILAETPTYNGSDFYLSLPPMLQQRAIKRLVSVGVPEERIFADDHGNYHAQCRPIELDAI